MKQLSAFVLLLLVLAAPLSAGLRDDFNALSQLRNDLAAQLQKRRAADAEKGPAEDLVLEFDEGADRNNVTLLLQRRGGAWMTGRAEVLAWSQGTMQEWRGFHLGNGAGSAWQPNMRFPVDTKDALLDNGKLGGRLSVPFLLDETVDDRLPMGKPNSWWDKFIPTGHTVTRNQQFDVSAVVHDDISLMELIIEGGVHWKGKHKKTGKELTTRRPILVRVEAPGTRFTITRASTPTWNQGWHEVYAAGLDFKNGKISGDLVVKIHQDGWVPFGGKTAQHDPWVTSFSLQAELKGEEVRGIYKASGDMGEYEGVIHGTGGRAVLGRYVSSGDFGDQTGSISGMALEPEPEVKTRLRELDQLPSSEPEAVAAAAKQINGLLHDIRALHLALSNYPMRFSEASRQTVVPEPAWPKDNAPIAEYCHVAATRYACLGKSTALSLPDVQPEGDRSAYAGVASLQKKADGTALLSGSLGGRWHRITDWKVLGPFTQTPGLDHQAAAAQDLVALPGLSYVERIDRLRSAVTDGPSRTWAALSPATDRIALPEQRPGFYQRFRGKLWYAMADVESEKSRTLRLSLEARDHSKLWINGRLVWVAGQKPWRYRPLRREVIEVKLDEGLNRFIFRTHNDRRISWVRLAITDSAPKGQLAAAPDKPYAGSHVFPDADPPLAWDIEKGINVAWRKEGLGGRTRPLFMNGRLLMTSAPETIQCVDAKSGKVLWQKQCSIFKELVPDAAQEWAQADTEEKRIALVQKHNDKLGFSVRRAGDLRISRPVSDGTHVWFHTGTGLLACYHIKSGAKWHKRTHLAKAELHVYGGKVICEGPPSSGWPLPATLAAPTGKKKRRPRAVGILVVDGKTGDENNRWTINGRYHGGFSRLFPVIGAEQEKACLLTSAGPVIDIEKGEVIAPLDIDKPGGGAPFGGTSGYPAGTGFGRCINADCVFLASQEQNTAIRFRAQNDGKLARIPIWESNYEHAGFGLVGASAVATEKHVFTWHPVLDRGPHCPDARLELHVHDALTGRNLARIKPALQGAVMHHVKPVVAGGYVFCSDSGGGSHGGSPYGQVAVVTASDNAQLICRNKVDIGFRASPVFAGDRMYIRSDKALTCIAVTDQEGREYQARRIAATVFDEIGLDLGIDKLAIDIDPADPAELGAGVPVATLKNIQPTEFWLAAGPLPLRKDEPDIGKLRPVPGLEVSFGGKRGVFKPVSREQAYNDPPVYRRQSALQGTGDICPFFYTWLNPTFCVTEKESAIFYTVLDNTRERYVVPCGRKRGTVFWLNGRKLDSNKPLHLKPGLYPFLVVAGPGVLQRTRAPFMARKVNSGMARPDTRLAPGFSFIANPNLYRTQQLKRIRGSKAQLELITRVLPKTPDAKRAEELLARL